MPIPIAQIPNAPQVGGPVLTPTAAGPQGQRAQNVNLLSAAGQVNAPKLQQGMFDGAAEGMAIAGRSIASLGAVGERISGVIADNRERLVKFDDEVNLAGYEAKLEEGFAAYEGESASMPDSEFIPGWQARFAKVSEKASKDLKLSPDGMRRLQLYNIKFLGDTTRRLVSASSHAKVSRGMAELDAKLQRREAAGDFEGAFDELYSFRDKGLLSEAETLDRENKITENQRQAWVVREIGEDPWNTAKDLAQARKSGKSELFDWMTNPVDIARAEAMARSTLRVANGDLSDAIDQGIASGKITTPEQIRKMIDGRFPESEIERHMEGLKARFAATPAGYEKLQADRALLRNDIALYDPSKDPEDAQYYKIKDSIRKLMPAGDVKDILDPLQSKRSEFLKAGKVKLNNPAMNEAIGQLRIMFDAGDLGNFKAVDGDGKIAVDPKSRAKAAEKMARFQIDMEGWARAHPEEANEPDKVFERLNKLISEDKELTRNRKSVDSPWWQLWKRKKVPEQLPPPLEIKRRVQSESSKSGPLGNASPTEKAKPQASGKSTAQLSEEADRELVLPEDGPDFTLANTDIPQ